MNRIPILALLLLLGSASLALAAPQWREIELDTTGIHGGKQIGWPTFQKVKVTYEGRVSVDDMDIITDAEKTGWATRAQMEALDRAVRRARLGRNMPARLPGSSYDFTLQVSSRLSTRRGQVRGRINHLGNKESRLRPILDAVLAIAEDIVTPSRPRDLFRGRVDASGWRTKVVRRGGFEVEVQPREFAERLEALDGAQVEIRGEVKKVSAGRYVLTASELLSPRLGSLRGEVEGSTLVVSGRRVELEGPGLAVIERLGADEARIQGYLYEGPRGVRSAFATGVLARVTRRDYPFEVGDEVLVTGVRTWGRSLDATRLSDGRSSWLRSDRLEVVAAASGGAIGALSALGQ